MCLRVFIASTAPLAPRGDDTFSVRELVDEGSQTLARRLGGHTMEAMAYTGCACGFAVSATAVTAGATTREELERSTGALTDREREEVEGSMRSLASLREVLATALEAGPVKLYACWHGEEHEVFEEVRAVELTHFRDALDPFPERVVLELSQSDAPHVSLHASQSEGRIGR